MTPQDHDDDRGVQEDGRLRDRVPVEERTRALGADERLHAIADVGCRSDGRLGRQSHTLPGPSAIVLHVSPIPAGRPPPDRRRRRADECNDYLE
jgi:hypothetical protein